MYIPRYYQNLNQFLGDGRVVIVYGPRRVGKTTLLKKFLDETDMKYRYATGDNMQLKEVMNSQYKDKILKFAEGLDLLAIDEAQYISNIGMGLKILVDYAEDLEIIATGSSSFDLSDQVGEPLVGRKWDLTLYPVSQLELSENNTNYELEQSLEKYLIYGSYPEVLTADTEQKKRKILKEIVNSYLLKDILSLQGIKSPKKVMELLQMLAFQVGNQVSYHELATDLKMSTKTIEKYLYLLEEAFVIKSVWGFSRNLRKEITKKNQYYFVDTGIRNAVIDSFNSFDLRNDVGQLWENFLAIERIKKQEYTDLYANNYFWRTYDQKEIDWVEQREGKLYGYEFKWSEDKQPSAPKEWGETYDNSEYKVINPSNYLKFIA